MDRAEQIKVHVNQMKEGNCQHHGEAHHQQLGKVDNSQSFGLNGQAISVSQRRHVESNSHRSHHVGK